MSCTRTRGGFIFVYDRSGKPVNVYKGVDAINFVKDIKPDGTLVGRVDYKEGKHENLCPAIAGGYSWNAGTYNPKTGLFYRVGYEWCIDLTVVKTEPITEPVVQLNIGADFTFVRPRAKNRWAATSVRAIRSPARSSSKSPTSAQPPRQPAEHRRQRALRARGGRHAGRV